MQVCPNLEQIAGKKKAEFEINWAMASITLSFRIIFFGGIVTSFSFAAKKLLLTDS
jgi:hypothetical protein